MAQTRKPILCVDWDGVIHSYTSPWTDAVTISDGPVPGALAWLTNATKFFAVQIYSSRSKVPGAAQAMLEWTMAHAVKEFGPDHPLAWPAAQIDYPLLFVHEKPAAFLTIDDRAICFEGDFGVLDPETLLNFKPWNKRPKLGATGKFPQGVLNDNDEGELTIGIALDPLDGLVHLDFGKPVAWTAFSPETAVQIARTLLKHAGAKIVDITF